MCHEPRFQVRAATLCCLGPRELRTLYIYICIYIYICLYIYICIGFVRGQVQCVRQPEAAGLIHFCARFAQVFTSLGLTSG